MFEGKLLDFVQEEEWQERLEGRLRLRKGTQRGMCEHQDCCRCACFNEER